MDEYKLQKQRWLLRLERPGRVFARLWPGVRAESLAVMSSNHKVKALLHQTEMSVTELEGYLTPRGSPMHGEYIPRGQKLSTSW